MLLLINKFKIQSNEFGFKISKPKGNQWTTIGYYPDLESAVKDLFEYRVRTELKDFVVDFNDVNNLELQKTELFEKIESIKDEILGGLK